MERQTHTKHILCMKRARMERKHIETAVRNVSLSEEKCKKIEVINVIDVEIKDVAWFLFV